jgi:hypothetical protein
MLEHGSVGMMKIPRFVPLPDAALAAAGRGTRKEEGERGEMTLSPNPTQSPCQLPPATDTAEKKNRISPSIIYLRT